MNVVPLVPRTIMHGGLLVLPLVVIPAVAITLLVSPFEEPSDVQVTVPSVVVCPVITLKVGSEPPEVPAVVTCSIYPLTVTVPPSAYAWVFCQELPVAIMGAPKKVLVASLIRTVTQ